jgi:hypothetical protein
VVFIAGLVGEPLAPEPKSEGGVGSGRGLAGVSARLKRDGGPKWIQSFLVRYFRPISPNNLVVNH